MLTQVFNADLPTLLPAALSAGLVIAAAAALAKKRAVEVRAKAAKPKRRLP